MLCYEWPPVGGGGGRVAKDVAEALARRGHHIRAQTVRLAGQTSQEIDAGVEVFRTWGFRSRPDRCSPLEMGGYVVTSFGPTLGHLRQFRPDVLHAHFAVPTGAVALAAASLGRLPYVITAHLGDVPGAVPEQTNNLFRWLGPAIWPIWSRAAGVTAVSQFVADLSYRAYGRSPTVISNGIALNGRPPLADRKGSTPRLIFVGRLNPQKNLDYIIPVLSGLRDLTWEFDIVGDGEERPKLEQGLAQSGLTGRVRFHGWVPRQAVDQLLSEADIFLLPSKVEGLSVAVLEALKFGLAVVASDLPTLHDTVTDGVSGWLLPLENPGAWIIKLRDLLTNPNRLRQIREASWSAAEKFDLERITDGYEEALRAAAFGRPAAHAS